jgi:tetratricopeptide (TPR) repeat protein
MSHSWITAISLLVLQVGTTSAHQSPQGQPQSKRTAETAPVQDAETGSAAGSFLQDKARADTYYYFTMGHFYEQQYEATSDTEYATKAIEAYKKAYALDPRSPVIGERLAEMYWKAQRTHDAVMEAQELLKQNPDDVTTRRLLGEFTCAAWGRWIIRKETPGIPTQAAGNLNRSSGPSNSTARFIVSNLRIASRRYGWRGSIACTTILTRRKGCCGRF